MTTAPAQRGTVSPQDLSAEYALRQSFVQDMRRFARRLHNIEKAKSRIQYAIARKLLDEWEAGGYAGELTKDNFYCEASRVICDELQIALVSNTGETLKVWCEVYRACENIPEVLKREMPFEYFRQARWLYNKSLVASPLAAIATALDHELTADEMRNWYLYPPIIDPRILELRKLYPECMWGLVNLFPSLNGNRERVEYHANEIRKLIAEEHIQ